MRRLAVRAAVAAVLISIAATPGAAAALSLDEAVLAEVNFARTRPQAYARELQRMAVAWTPGAGYARTNPADVEEAIDFLMRQPSLPPLRFDERLADAAYDHASTQGARGGLGHVGVHGETLGQRLQRRGVWAGVSAENISYGYDDPAGVVRQLIVDSGVPNRGHRANIFAQSYQAAGVGCARHAVWGAMCVIDFAGAYARR